MNVGTGIKAGLHVFLEHDSESNQHEAVEHDESGTERYEEREDNGLDGIINGCCRHGADTGGLKAHGTEDLPSLMSEFLASSNEDSTNCKLVSSCYRVRKVTTY